MASTGATPSLLDSVLRAHGGLERFDEIKSIDLSLNFSGWVLAVKGYPKHYQPKVTIDTKKQHSKITGFAGEPGNTLHFTPTRTWIERADGTISMDRSDPRASFAGHVRTTPWDDLHLTYFVGYAFWNYLTTPFCFTWPGVSTREIAAHVENGQTWRTLEVTFPESFAAHCKVQRFYFNDKFMLQRQDYNAEVAGGIAAHYSYDHKEIGGIVFPMMRRVVVRDAETDIALLSGPSVFMIEYCSITLNKENGGKVVNHGAYSDLGPNKMGE